MEVLLILLLLAPLAGLFGGGGDDDGSVEGDGPVEQAGSGNDTLAAENGDDHAFLGGGGNDNLTGQGGRDALAGQSGNDVLTGGTGGDLMLGGAGNDTLYGQVGNDLVVGGAGDDLAQGGSGNDYIIGGNGSDTLRGFDGDDFVNGLDVDGSSVPAELDILHPDDISTVRNALQSFFGQTMTDSQLDQYEEELVSQGNTTGAIGADVLQGGNGNDILVGNAGDTLTGDTGLDEFRLVGGPGAPVVIADFDPASEDIRIYVPESNTGELQMVNVANGVELRVGSSLVGLVNGQTLASLDPSQITVLRFDPNLPGS